jgi:hypothetical protein
MWEVGIPPLLWSFPPTAAFTRFPAPDCWACAAAPDSCRVCLQLTAQWEVVFPPLPWSFPPSPLSQVFLLLVAGGAPPPPPSLACPGLFIYSCVRNSPPLLFRAQGAPPSLLHVFIVLIVYYSVSAFFLGGGSVCPEGYADMAQGCLWEYHLQLSSPCPVPFQAVWALVSGGPRGPPGFSLQCEVGSSAQAGGVEGSSFASCRWPWLQGVSPASLQDFTLGGTLSASSL